ncbi:Uncharacterized protein PBTT_06777 [Plasmodiophora brassicae]
MLVPSVWPSNPTGFTPDALANPSNKAFFVTGADPGLGYATALALARKPASAMIRAPSGARANDAIAMTSADNVPNASVQLIQASVACAAHTFRATYGQLDRLISDAGSTSLKSTTCERLRVLRQYTVRDHEGRHRVPAPDEQCRNVD